MTILKSIAAVFAIAALSLVGVFAQEKRLRN